MRSFVGAALAIALSPMALAEEACQINERLVAEGWIGHDPQEFPARLQQALEQIQRDNGLVHTTSGFVHSDELGKLVVRTAYDQINTPDEIMIDDLVIFSDDENQRIYELRWFDGTDKHFVTAHVQCAHRPVPWAFNSMW